MEVAILAALLLGDALLAVILYGGYRLFWIPSFPDPQLLAESALHPSTNGDRPKLDPAWSPEGWGPPDSEITMPEGDEYLRRLRMPPPDDDDR